jgi:hypothetical protein
MQRRRCARVGATDPDSNNPETDGHRTEREPSVARRYRTFGFAALHGWAKVSRCKAAVRTPSAPMTATSFGAGE